MSASLSPAQQAVFDAMDQGATLELWTRRCRAPGYRLRQGDDLEPINHKTARAVLRAIFGGVPPFPEFVRDSPPFSREVRRVAVYRKHAAERGGAARHPLTGYAVDLREGRS